MAIVHLCLGSNLGNRENYFKKAMNEIENRIGPIVALSSLYETEAWGYDSDNKFLNGCIAVNTALSPKDTLSQLKDIETLQGRLKTAKNDYSDRVIDIDIIFFDDLVLEIPGLTIPHPKMQQRLFVLNPLFEIAPDYIHPVLKKTVRTLLSEINLQP